MVENLIEEIVLTFPIQAFGLPNGVLHSNGNGIEERITVFSFPGLSVTCVGYKFYIREKSNEEGRTRFRDIFTEEMKARIEEQGITMEIVYN